MKTGKISGNVLKRSVLKILEEQRAEIIQGAAANADCAAFCVQERENVLLTMDPVTVNTSYGVYYGITKALNNIATGGGETIGVMLTVLLPEDTEEKELKAYMREAEECCKENHIAIMGGHTEVTAAVKSSIITVTGVGKAPKTKKVSFDGAAPGQNIIMTKYLGLQGTAILAEEKEEILKNTLPEALINEAKAYRKYMSIIPEAATAVKSGASSMHDVTEGGIFGALWELAESAGVGLEIDLKRIPVKQETIEICEVLDVNPYELLSGGALIITAEDGFGMVRELNKAGVNAALIGKCTAGNDRVIFNGEDKRFLEPAKPDEIHRILK